METNEYELPALNKHTGWDELDSALAKFATDYARQAIAPLLQDLAAHEASNRIKTENLETLREQNATLRKALRWTVASLSAAASAYQKHASRHNTVRPRSVSDPFFTTRSRDFDAAVEVARAALGESDE